MTSLDVYLGYTMRFVIYSRHRLCSKMSLPKKEFVDVSTLVRIHVVAIVLHIASGGLGLYFIQDGNPNVDVSAPLFEYVMNPGPGESYFRPTPKVIFSVAILTPLVVVEFITAFFHIIYIAALIFPGVDSFLRRWILDSPSTNPLRWIEYGITATMLASFGNLAIGIIDFYVFVRNVFCGITLQGLGYMIELLGPYRLNSQMPAVKIYRGLYYFQGLLNNLPFVGILLYQTFASTTHGAFNIFLENTFPLAIWYNTFGVICQMSFYEWRQFVDPKFTEKWYIILSVSTKITIFWAEFATFKKITEDNGVVPSSGIDWDLVRYLSLSVPAGTVLCTAIYDAMAWKQIKGGDMVTYAFYYSRSLFS